MTPKFDELYKSLLNEDETDYYTSEEDVKIGKNQADTFSFEDIKRQVDSGTDVVVNFQYTSGLEMKETEKTNFSTNFMVKSVTPKSLTLTTKTKTFDATVDQNEVKEDVTIKWEDVQSLSPIGSRDDKWMIVAIKNDPSFKEEDYLEKDENDKIKGEEIN